MLIISALMLIILLSLGYILVSPISVYFGLTFGDALSGFAGARIFPFEFRSHKDATRKAVRTKTKDKKSRIQKGRKACNSAVELFNIAVDEWEILHKITVSLLKLLGGILQSPDQYYLKIYMTGGLGPPDLTGQLYGTVLSVQQVLGRSVSLKYRPDYLDDKMSGEVAAGATVRAYKLLREILVFAWHLPKIRTLRLYHRLRKGG